MLKFYRFDQSLPLGSNIQLPFLKNSVRFWLKNYIEGSHIIPYNLYVQAGEQVNTLMWNPLNCSRIEVAFGGEIWCLKLINQFDKFTTIC